MASTKVMDIIEPIDGLTGNRLNLYGLTILKDDRSTW
jgi:hypothetical protein